MYQVQSYQYKVSTIVIISCVYIILCKVFSYYCALAAVLISCWLLNMVPHEDGSSCVDLTLYEISTVDKYGLRVKNLKEKGKCVFSAKKFDIGDVVLMSDPFVTNVSCLKSYCHWCLRDPSSPRYDLISSIKNCSKV